MPTAEGHRIKQAVAHDNQGCDKRHTRPPTPNAGVRPVNHPDEQPQGQRHKEGMGGTTMPEGRLIGDAELEGPYIEVR